MSRDMPIGPARRGRRALRVLTVGSALALAACGDDPLGNGLPPPAAPLVRISTATPLEPGCTPVRGDSTQFKNGEVEPHVAVDPSDPAHLVAAWQQDRFSDGGARAIVYASSYDGGATWTQGLPPLVLPASVCGGLDDYERASDPWVTIRADGVAFASAVAFDDGRDSQDNAVLVFRANPVGMLGMAQVLIADGPAAFNDKAAIAADPGDASYLYAAWTRLTADGRGPALLARSVDGGLSWSAPAEVHDPGLGNQTLNVTPVVAPDGTLYLHFTEIDRTFSLETLQLRLLRSTDHGASFAPVTTITQIQPIGAYDPNDISSLREGAGLANMAVGPAGELVISWQDFNYNHPLRDTVYWMRSTNGGATWPQGGMVGLDNDAQAFTPTVAIGADGTFAVSFFDMRDDDHGDGPLSVTHWVATKSIGSPWVEHRVSEPFDIRLAPRSSNPFLGDYMGLVATSGSFVPVFVQTNNQGTANRTDVYVRPLGTLAAPAKPAVVDEKPLLRGTPDAAASRRAYLAVMRGLAARIPRWAERQARFEAVARARGLERRQQDGE